MSIGRDSSLKVTMKRKHSVTFLYVNMCPTENREIRWKDQQRSISPVRPPCPVHVYRNKETRHPVGTGVTNVVL